MIDRWSPRRFRIGCVVTTIYWCGMAVAMHVPLPPSLAEHSFTHEDKVVHAALYAVLSVLLWATVGAYQAGRGWVTTRRTAVRIFGVIAAYGLLDEVTQPLTGRTLDVWDYATDLAAAAVALAVGWTFRRERSTNR